MTLLLISSTSAHEAIKAFRGGADIIDIKNPKEGSLGASFPWIISETKKSIPAYVPISAAIGDFPDLPGSASLATLGAIEAGADIVKVGLKGPRRLEDAAHLMKQVVRAAKLSSKKVKVVVCGYGDFERTNTIEPFLLPEVAKIANAEIVMIDTGIKDGKPLTDFLSKSELKEIVEKAHSLGIEIALSGSLGPDEIRTIKSLGPDIVGVRGAVCISRDRNGELSVELVKRIKEILVS